MIKGLSMHSQYRIRSELPHQRLGEELMVFDHEADRVHVLNGTSAVVWECLSRGEDLEGVAEGLRAAFRVGDGQDVSLVVEAAVEQLRERGLLELPTEVD
jgi:PqqD family protein of HPr-rel-A system